MPVSAAPTLTPDRELHRRLSLSRGTRPALTADLAARCPARSAARYRRRPAGCLPHSSSGGCCPRPRACSAARCPPSKAGSCRRAGWAFRVLAAGCLTAAHCPARSAARYLAVPRLTRPRRPRRPPPRRFRSAARCPARSAIRITPGWPIRIRIPTHFPPPRHPLTRPRRHRP